MPRPSPHKGSKTRLPVLTTKALKVAELSTRTVFTGSQPFPASHWHQLSAYGPHVIAASAGQLQRLTERLDLGTLELPSLDHAIYVLTGIGDKPLADTLRVILWQRFGLPVYEIYLSPEQRVLAHECEAQEGWHVEPGVQFFLHGGQLSLQTADTLLRTGISSKLETSPCPCGRPGLRILFPGSAVLGSFKLAESA